MNKSISSQPQTDYSAKIHTTVNNNWKGCKTFHKIYLFCLDMFIVAVTGGIATGKSTVTKVFERNGIPVIDADRIARESKLYISYGML